MCLLNQRLLLIEAGSGGGGVGVDTGRTGSARFLSHRETVAGKLCRPRASAFTTSTLGVSHERIVQRRGDTLTFRRQDLA